VPEEQKKRNATNIKELPLKEYLKQLPPPPPEHSHELKMEKRIKKLIKEQQKNTN